MDDHLSALANSYLDHIRIAVMAADQGAPLRDFIDNWNAYRCEHDHHRSKGMRPKWFNNPSALGRLKMLDTLDFKSTGAASILEASKLDPRRYSELHKARDPSVRLVIDHAVPISAMVAPLFAGTVELTREGIAEHLIRWYRLGLLSKQEDARLNELGLRSSMPPGWDGVDCFARYRLADIHPA